jgi:hypothetical protein
MLDFPISFSEKLAGKKLQLFSIFPPAFPISFFYQLFRFFYQLFMVGVEKLMVFLGKADRKKLTGKWK